ncbi:MAG: SPFH domain-containing protein [Candidatus Dormibacteria bacterium]
MPSFFPAARENIAVPDDRKAQIVFKWPDLSIRRYSNAIVAPDEVAVFMYQGDVKGTLPPGRHTLDATEIPFLGFFADHLTGGNLYRTEIYFVGSREYPELRFGGRIDNVQDPVTGLVVSLGVYGEYSLKVIDPPLLLTNLTGTVDVTDNEAITDWVAQQLLKVLRTDVTQHVVSKGWPILGLAAYVPEVEADVIALSASQLAAYGLAVARMGNFTISLGEEDEAQLKTLARDTAYSRLAGSFQQYAAGELQLGAGQGMAQGGQAVGAAFLGAGIGLGGQAAQMPATGPAPPAAPGFAGGGGAYQPSPAGDGAASLSCPACAAANAAGAKFCAACGAALPAGEPHACAGCGASLPAAARFCPVCGRAVEPGAAAAATPASPAQPSPPGSPRGRSPTG